MRPSTDSQKVISCGQRRASSVKLMIMMSFDTNHMMGSERACEFPNVAEGGVRQSRWEILCGAASVIRKDGVYFFVFAHAHLCVRHRGASD